MKKINRIFSKLVTTVLSGTLVTSSIPSYAVYVPFSSDTEEKIPEPNIISVVEGETSEYGLTPVYYVDENGNKTEPNLIPEKEDKATVLPSEFDLRDYGYIPSVRGQEDTGTCWAHATLAAAESNMIMKGLADKSIDLSESHLTWFAQGKASTDINDPLYGDGESLGNTDLTNGAYDKGGNSSCSKATLARWSGVQLEENAPPVIDRPAVDESLRYTSYGYLVNSDDIDADDRESIKQHLMNTGALMCSYYDDDEKHISGQYYPYAAYYNSDIYETNHAVTIVGWDDNYSKSNFKSDIPPGNGAWIIRNSWGDDNHIDGYFYLSYYDTSLSRITSFEIADTSTYNNIYQYDGAKPRSYPYYSDETFTAANIFTSELNETVSAAAFYTHEASVPYIVSVYADVEDGNPVSGTLLTTQKGTIDYAGYHVIDFNEPVAVSKGTKFSVVVTLNQIGAGMAIQECSNLSDCSYFTWGTPSSRSRWNDTIEKYSSTACIKALTRSDILINSSNFPDSVFRNYVSRFDSDSDGKLSYSEISKVYNMNLSNLGISDFTGIEFFTELTTLNCSYNPVVKLDISHNNSVTNFICYGCSIKLGDVICNGFTVNGLDLSKVSDVQGMTVKNSSFIPESTTMYYTYNCGKNYTFNMTLVADSLTHSYGSWSDNGNVHIRTCYYCNDINSENHSFGNWNSGLKQHSHTCQICGGVKSENHSFGDWTADKEVHTHFCEICGISESENHLFGKPEPYSNSEHTEICESCGYTENISHDFGSFTYSDESTHTKSCSDCSYSISSKHRFGEWTVSDKNSHIRTCTDCGYTETFEHEYDDWTISDDGNHSRECNICGYTESIEHSFGKWTFKDENVHTRICDDCEYTETFSHEYGEWIALGGGIQSRQCKICGYTERSEHRFSDWTVLNEKNHTRTCDDCGYTETLRHTYDNWVSSDNDSHSRKCNVCGYTESIEHSFSNWTESGENSHKRVCDDCGKIVESEHNFTDFTSLNSESHFRICNDCGYHDNSLHSFGTVEFLDETYHLHSCDECGYVHVSEHDFSDWHDNGNATQIRICNDCEYSEIKEFEYISGDINGDGRTDSFDLVLARQKLKKGFDNSVELAAADVNNDGRFNKNDILLLQDFILGKIKTF
ncbi:MAG: hypothetical protein K2I80_02495 [Ruminococcus sp.]|nr:hypothetical protein [Ruminococcus sp.]MDE6849500.1 hypothetical protein [Ruminococcus sp.]